MAPKSNLGKLGAFLSAILVLICMGPGYFVFAAAGTLNCYTKELNVAKAGRLLLGPALAANGLPWYGGQPANEPGRSHRVNAVRTKSETPRTVLVPVHLRDVKDLGVGKLLVASPNLADPNFAKTVIPLVHSDDQGFVGLSLNWRTNLALSRVLKGLPGTKDRSDPAYLGGPVEVPAVIALLHSPNKVEGADRIFGGVYLISTKTLLEQTLAVRPDPQVFHVYLVHAGWDSDQLRKEVELGAWFIFPADPGVVFNSDPGSLWPQMIRKTEQKIASGMSGSMRSRVGSCAAQR
jgi:putative transcriptional regulator